MESDFCQVNNPVLMWLLTFVLFIPLVTLRAVCNWAVEVYGVLHDAAIGGL